MALVKEGEFREQLYLESILSQAYVSMKVQRLSERSRLKSAEAPSAERR